jgi:hypothetical protein
VLIVNVAPRAHKTREHQPKSNARLMSRSQLRVQIGQWQVEAAMPARICFAENCLHQNFANSFTILNNARLSFGLQSQPRQRDRRNSRLRFEGPWVIAATAPLLRTDSKITSHFDD